MVSPRDWTLGCTGMPYVFSNNSSPAFSWEAWVGMAGVNERRRGIGRSALDAAKPGGWGFGSKGNSLPVTETWDSSIFHMQGEWGPQRGSDLVTITQQVMAMLGLGPSSSDLQPKTHSSTSNGGEEALPILKVLGLRTWSVPS